jgi:hypothetical protein
MTAFLYVRETRENPQIGEEVSLNGLPCPTMNRDHSERSGSGLKHSSDRPWKRAPQLLTVQEMIATV